MIMTREFQFSLKHIIFKISVLFSVLQLSNEQVAGVKYFEDATDGTSYMGCELILRDPELTRANVPEFWPGGQVPYALSSDFREQDHEALNAALEDFHKFTCIRFLPRTNEEAYVNILMNFNLSGICGSAEACYHGKPQIVEIGSECSGKSVFVHELGHALCLYHEQTRPDRDQYLDLSKCENSTSISAIVDATTTRGHVYDYFSHMHYECSSCVGMPKLGVVHGDCGALNPLGVIDTDKLNAFYNCQGCLRHRWYRLDSLTPEQQSSLVNFASQEGDNGPVHMCRGQTDEAAILPGRYIPEEKACYVVDGLKSAKLTRDVQLLGIPGEMSSIIGNGKKGYTLLDPQDNSTEQNRIRVGRSAHRSTQLAAVTWLLGDDGRKYTEIGQTTSSVAYFPKGDGFVYIESGSEGSSYIGIFGCIE